MSESIEYFVLEGTDHVVPTPLLWAGIPSIRLGYSEPRPTWPRTFLGMSIHNFSLQPVPLSQHPNSKEFLLTVQSKHTFFQFKAIPPYPITICTHKRSCGQKFSYVFVCNFVE